MRPGTQTRQRAQAEVRIAMVEPGLPMEFGPYILLEKIGQGGMADIFKARRVEDGDGAAPLVIKKILPQYAGNDVFTEMLEQEAEVSKSVHHQKIVGFYDFGQIDGEHFIAMEHVDGKDLLRVLARCTKTKVRIPLDLAAYIVAEVADALHYAHTRRGEGGKGLKIVHRDVSPANILLSYEGAVKVTDFGVAKADFQPEKEVGEGMLKGKVGYMSPEQVSGRPFNFKADIFSLGILLYETLTLKRAFMGRTDLETLLNIRSCRIEMKLEKHAYLPIALLEVLRHTLTSSLDQRYASSAVCAEALRGYTNSVGGFADKFALRWFLRGLFNLDDASLPGKPCVLSETRFASLSVEAAESAPPQRLREAAEGPIPAPGGHGEAHQRGPDLDEPPADPSLGASFGEGNDVELPRDSEPSPLGDPEPGITASKGLGPTPAPEQAAKEASPRKDRPVLAPWVSRSNSRQPAKAENIFATDRGRAGATPDGARVRYVLRTSPAELMAGISELTGRELEIEPGVLRNASFRLKQRDDEIFGPINFWNLARMIVRGGVVPAEGVSINGEAWVPVQDVHGLRELFRKNLELKQQAPIYDGPATVVNLPSTFYRIAGERSSGLLRVQAGMGIRDVYFRKGRVVDVHSTVRRDLFGQMLVRNELVSASVLDDALKSISFGSRRIGEALAELGEMSVLVIPQLVEQSARDRLRQIFRVDGGWYAFFQGSEFVVECDMAPIATAIATTFILRDGLAPDFFPRMFEGFAAARIHVRDKTFLGAGDLGFTPREFRFVNNLLRTRKIDDTLAAAGDSDELRSTVFRVAYILLQAGLIEFPEGSPVAKGG